MSLYVTYATHQIALYWLFKNYAQARALAITTMHTVIYTAGINTVRFYVKILLPFINFENLLYIKHDIRTFTVIHKVNFENTLSIICPLES